MKYRRLRIAWSIGWGVVYLVVIVFWVRSYWWMDGGRLKLLPSWNLDGRGGDGRMIIRLEHRPVVRRFSWRSDPITFPTPPNAPNRMPWFDLNFWPWFARLYTAHWFLAVVAGFFAAIPWCPRRFSVRGLLIATTVVATLTVVIVRVDKTF
jgi:hypothetical protein